MNRVMISAVLFGIGCMNTGCRNDLESRIKTVTGPVAWVRNSGGVFKMGQSEVVHFSAKNESPVHEVKVDAFLIAKTETTVGQYRKCIEANVCTELRSDTNEKDCSLFRTDAEEYPINCVSWFQANEFCKWAGGRLPFEAEWEYAAKGKEDRNFPWGNKPPDCDTAVIEQEGMASGCGRDWIWPVCSKPRGNTSEGICDLGGNVSEWVYDWYKEYDRNRKENPKGPKSGKWKVFRGGSFISLEVQQLRSTKRYTMPPDSKLFHTGFRCAKSL